MAAGGSAVFIRFAGASIVKEDSGTEEETDCLTAIGHALKCLLLF